MAKKEGEGISLSRYLTLPKWKRDLNKQNPLHSQSVTDWRLFDELKRGTLPQPLHDAFLDLIRERLDENIGNQITKAEKPRADGVLKSIIEKLAARPGKAKELWPALFGLMEEREMEPQGSGFTYQYRDSQDRLKQISFKRFQTLLGNARAKNKSH